MKCNKCGSEIEQDSIFCQFCGNKIVVNNNVKRYCRECGAPITEEMKYCSNCGTDVNALENLKNKPKETKNNNSMLGSKEKTIPTSKKSNKKTDKIIIIAIICITLCILLLVAFLLLRNRKENQQANISFDIINPIVDKNATIEPGTEYAYMSDEWDVYIATAVSDSIIKIEHWHKSSSTDKKMKLNKELGSFKIDDSTNGFMWIDNEKTAFTFSLTDKSNTRVRKNKKVIFTINNSNSNVCKGTNYDEKIACYTYTNDDWHMYKAIPLSNNLIKVECWARASSGLFGKYLFAWDVGVIDLSKTKTDFAWGDDKHSAFTITMKDFDNDYYWKNEKLVSFELENKKYKYPTVCAYLGITDNSSVVDNTEEETSSVTQTKPTETTSTVVQTKPIATTTKTYQTKPTDTVSTAVQTKPTEEIKTTETQPSKITTVVLPDPNSKLGKDLDTKGTKTVYYINVDGIKNKPSKTTWETATVTDGVASYLNSLKEQGFDVKITSSDKTSPRDGFTIYETNFEVSNGEITWTMYLNIQDEKYVEYELDIHIK